MNGIISKQLFIERPPESDFRGSVPLGTGCGICTITHLSRSHSPAKLTLRFDVLPR
jgi:hypothetical protein